MKSTASYSSVVDFKSMFDGKLNSIKQLIDWQQCKDPYYALRIAEVRFLKPYLKCADYDVIALVVMRFLIKYAYHTSFKYGKFTIGYVMKIPPTGDVTYTIDVANSLADSRGNAVPNMDVYVHIQKLLIQKAEDYDKGVLSGVFIRLYRVDVREEKEKEKYLPHISDEVVDTLILELMNSGGKGGGELPEVKSMASRKRRYPNHIPALKPTSNDRRPFIVADMETVLIKKLIKKIVANKETDQIDEVHVPYAAGFLVVHPGDDVGAKPDYSIETYFSEDHLLVIPEYEDRSNRMLFDFLERLAVVAGETKIRTVYFHNFSRFDGILLMKYYASRGDKYSIKPLMRNQRLYELAVYRGKKQVLRLRDSITLLPSSLATLAKTLCPQLGSKGSIQHDEVRVSNLKIQSAELLDYMKQDIRLLGGVMLKAQEIYWTQYKVDITNYLTLSSLSISIYRMSYYDENRFPIHIPSRNEDTFIRRGYYGGHADVYKPYGDNLYYYDVNSLYPYIMKSFPMPGGVPVWHGNLEGQELSNLYGFIEAYVECPSTMTRPFLPYRNEDKILLFPTGKFVGVYFSEELIYARDLGYTIMPLKGYLFEKKPSPFDSFVTSVFSQRQEAKKTGNEAMAYGYKILMNSLYGRFGINPESSITEVCNMERYNYLIINQPKLSLANKLSDNNYIVNYRINTRYVDDSNWNPPKISAVQMSAAITACSRIHMYKYISRPDCHYTDTDSAILGSPLPEDEISSIELGKLKIEHFVKNGCFLAPKSYKLETEDGGNIIKHKGPAKNVVNDEWFDLQYADLSRSERITMENNFKIDLETLHIKKKYLQVNLRTKVDTKREPVFDNNDAWVDTKPKNVIDYGGQDSTIHKLELKILQEKFDKKEKESASLQKESASLQKELASLLKELAKLREENQSQSAANLPEPPVRSPITEYPTELEKPTLYNHPKEAKKKKIPRLKKQKGKKQKDKKPKPKKKKQNDTS